MEDEAIARQINKQPNSYPKNGYLEGNRMNRTQIQTHVWPPYINSEQLHSMPLPLS